jgi:hypothetical protein
VAAGDPADPAGSAAARADLVVRAVAAVVPVWGADAPPSDVLGGVAATSRSSSRRN